MKKFHFKHKLPLMVALLVMAAVMLAGKMLEDTPVKQLTPFNTMVSPPVAKNLTVQLLKKPSDAGNILLTAGFDPEQVGAVTEFSVFVSSSNAPVKKQIVLHDDGLNGDERAGDAVFVATFNEDIKMFRSAIAASEVRLRKAGGKIISFEGRAGTVSTKDRLFDMNAFNRFEKVAIDHSIFDIPYINDPKAGTVAPDAAEDETGMGLAFQNQTELMPDEMIGDGGGGGPVVLPPPCNPIIDRAKSLFITDISVTEDPVRTYNPCSAVGNPDGAWTFKTLMSNMANQPLTGVTVDAFTQEWLDSWMRGIPRLTPGTSNPVVNTQVLDSRVHPFNTAVQATTILHAVIKPWLRAAASNPAMVVDSLPSSPNYWKTVWNTLVGKGYSVMNFSPFKLTAIVNRVDLSSTTTTTTGSGGYGGGTTTTVVNGGEGRFVYSIIEDPTKGGTGCSRAVSSLTQPFVGFNVIFEYGIPIRDCADLLAYQNLWRNQSDMPFGDKFNEYLEVITNRFTKANANPGANKNGSALNQLRTNEIAITSLLGGTLPTPYAPGSDGSVPFWQLREFTLDNGTKMLANTTTKLEPMSKFNGASFVPLTSSNTAADISVLANFVNANSAAIQANNYTVPLVSSGVNFLAGRADVHSPSAAFTPYHWNGSGGSGSPTFINNDSARFVFSLNTCSGCHGGETNTGFVHVRYIGFGHNVSFTSTSGGLKDISSFLTGLGADDHGTDNDADPNGLFFVKDPANRPAGRIRGFNDLLRREIFMKNLLCNGCNGGGIIFSMTSALTTSQVARTH